MEHTEARKMSDITEVVVDDQLVLGTKKRGKYREIAVLLPKLFEFAVPRGIRITGPPLFICHEMTEEEAMKADEEGNANVEVAIPVSERIEGKDEITCYELKGGNMAKIMHKGPYEACKPTYDKLFAWIGANGKEITGPIREVYLNDPREVGPEETLTEIYAPIG